MPCSMQCWQGPKAPKVANSSTNARGSSAPYAIPTCVTNSTNASILQSTLAKTCVQCKHKQQHNQQNRSQNGNCIAHQCQSSSSCNPGNSFTSYTNAPGTTTPFIAMQTLTVPPPPQPPQPLSTSFFPNQSNANHGKLLISNPVENATQPLVSNMCPILATSSNNMGTSSAVPSSNQMVFVPFALPSLVSMPTAIAQQPAALPVLPLQPTQTPQIVQPQRQQHQQHQHQQHQHQQQQQYHLHHHLPQQPSHHLCQPHKPQQQQQLHHQPAHCEHSCMHSNGLGSNLAPISFHQTSQAPSKPKNHWRFVPSLRFLATNAVSKYQREGRIPLSLSAFPKMEECTSTSNLDSENRFDPKNAAKTPNSEEYQLLCQNGKEYVW